MNCNIYISTFILFFVFAICLANVKAQTNGKASFTPVALQCEYRTSPLGVDTLLLN